MGQQLAFDFSSATPVALPPIVSRRMRGALGYHAGQAAEEVVARDYTRRGYDILHRRWRGPAGEIDLILRDGAGLIFVEVKKSRSISRAADRLTAAQMRRIYTSAEAFLGTQPHGSLTETRFDVALLDDRGQVRIVENAFGLM